MGPTGLTPEEIINRVYMKNLEEKNANFEKTNDYLRNYIFELLKELDELRKENIQLKMERDRYKGEVEELGGLLDEHTDY